jgi:hypothetical protein
VAVPSVQMDINPLDVYKQIITFQIVQAKLALASETQHGALCANVETQSKLASQTTEIVLEIILEINVSSVIHDSWTTEETLISNIIFTS